MIVEFGILACMIAVAVGVLLGPGKRRAGEVLLALLAVAALVVQSTLLVREARLSSQWRELATEELTARSREIVEFLRDKGSTALEEIRTVGTDPDTRALIASESLLSKTARRPVFLDLLERFPRDGRAGVTIYDSFGRPRAWSGWSPTATMSLAREPSGDAEVVEIREGNIYTLLEVTHPVRTHEGESIGYVVYQEPLRIQFPLENQFFSVDDALEELEGEGGVHADVALALSIGAIDDIRGVKSGPLKLGIQESTASATTTILATDEVVGRVSLTGLSKPTLFRSFLDPLRTLRDWLLLGVGLLVFARVWFLTGEIVLTRPGLLASLYTFLARFVLVVVARIALLVWSPREGLDPLQLFDPSWFASIRYGGLLRSPGDLLLTGAMLALAAREFHQLVLKLEPGIRRVASSARWISWLPAAVVALLVGSLVGFHWNRVMDIARNANTPLFTGLDPFTSAPVAVLELALLLGGTAFLFVGDTLVGISRAFATRFPRHLSLILIAALAFLASAVKMGAPDEVALSDFLRPLPALIALTAFAWVNRTSLGGPRFGLFLGAILAAATNVAPLFEGVESRRRELVELFALEHTESPSNTRHFLLESTLDYLAESDELKDAFTSGVSLSHANLAFILWAKSPLANVPAGCHLRLLDQEGRPFSTFTLGYPPELRENDSSLLPVRERGAIRFRREEIGSTRIDLYSGRNRLTSEGRLVGYLEVAMAYFDDLARPRSSGAAFPTVFTNLTTSEEFLRFTREVPDRVDRYRGDVLVASTDPEGGLGNRVPSIIVETLADSQHGGRWVERRIGGKLFDLYCVRERDGALTVGYLTFGLERHGLLDGGALLARSILVTLVITVLLLLLVGAFAWLAPGTGPRHLKFPRIGFRERVIGGFLIVSLLPTLFLGFAGRGLFVEEKRKEFQGRLEEDLRVARELLSTGLMDAARNAANTEEIRDLVLGRVSSRTLSKPASVDGLVAVSLTGELLGTSLSPNAWPSLLPKSISTPDTPLEFFRRRGEEIYACALVPVLGEDGVTRRGSVLAFHRIDPVLASELERRLGSAVSFFAGGQLAATSRPELYQSEILSDLVESLAYVKIELEGARRTVLESRVGETSFLASYAPLPDELGEPVGVVATLATFQGGGFDLQGSLVLSRIYFLWLFVFSVAIAIAFLLANRLTRPIFELMRGVKRIGSGELGHRIRSKATGEIGALVESVNTMSGQLAASEARDRERREYIEAIISHVASGVVSFDEDGRVATVNGAASTILEVDPMAAIGRPADQVVGGSALAPVMEAVSPLLSGRREEIVDEVELAAADDEEVRSIRLAGTRLTNSQGDAQGAVVVFEDLTDLIKSKKIKAWAEMARQVAHEIKNPLTPMKLSAQHLQQAWRDRHPKFERILEESTDTIVDRCEALRRIAIEFSDYARMPGRQIRREDLGHLLHEARRLYGESEGRSVDFRLEAPGGDLYSRVDKDEVMRLFINLIENSIQAMPEGGNLSVRAERENGSALVTIQDSGVGISPENLVRIFEPSFSTKTGGAGLGLPICKAIMEDYGGSIDIDSAVGSGTTVTLTFPVDES